MATLIDTATGPVNVSDLGRVLMHEHVFTFHGDVQGDYPWVEEQESIQRAIDRLQKLKGAGFSTIVDLTVFGLGRNASRVAAIAKAAGVNVVVATGMYAMQDMQMYFRNRLTVSGPTFFEDLFVREIQSGIGNTGIRAAILKCVTDRAGLTPDVETILRSVARAHLRTGVPISTHTDTFTEAGLLQQRVLRQEGVDLSEVIIGHSGDTTDLVYLQRLLDAGSYLGMDRFGSYGICSFEDRISAVVELCSRGFASRLVLSHDTNCGNDMLPLGDQSTRHYNHIPEVVLPELLARGVSDHDVDLMLTWNPRAIFEHASLHAKAIQPA